MFVYWCLLMSIDVYWCLLMFVDVYSVICSDLRIVLICPGAQDIDVHDFAFEYWELWISFRGAVKMFFLQGVHRSSRLARASIQDRLPSAKLHRSRAEHVCGLAGDRDSLPRWGTAVEKSRVCRPKNLAFMKSQRFSIFFHGFLDWELVFVFSCFSARTLSLFPAQPFSWQSPRRARPPHCFTGQEKCRKGTGADVVTLINMEISTNGDTPIAGWFK